MPEARHFVALNEVNTLRVAPAGAGAVELLLVDDVFAPGHESLTIAYAVHTVVARARLEIRSAAHGPEALASMDLGPTDLTPGSRYTVAWDGRVMCASGELAGRFANPLFSPYEVTIVFDAGSGEEVTPARAFAIAYHSIELRHGPWTYDLELLTSKPSSHELRPDRERRLRLRLNEAGFWAGPVEKDLDNGLLNATRRFRSRHPWLVRSAFLDYPTVIESDVEVEILGRTATRQAIETTAFADPSAESRILVEQLFQERGDRAELRADVERRRLTRPVVPVEAVVRLRTKAGDGVDVPASVGPVRVDFRIDEVGEDVGRLPSVRAPTFPVFAREFVQQVHDIYDTRDRKNCPVDHGGISEADGSWATATVLGRSLPPFELKSDPARKVVWCVAADFDPALPAAHGRAALLFRPSWMGGDGYRITARLNFCDRPNAAELDQLHGTIERRTGTFRIWREVPVATRVAWPGASARRRLDFERAPRELRHAFVALRPPVHEVAAKDILDDETYRAGVEPDAVVPISWFHIDERAVYGAPFTKQTTRAEDYKAELRGQLTPFFERHLPALAWELRRASQARGLGYGLIIVDFEHHVPVDVLHDPAKPSGGMDRDVRFFAGISRASENGVCFVDVLDDIEQVYSHEIGHELFLNHSAKLLVDPEDPEAGGVRPDEHDDQSTGCIMGDGSFTLRHFCGKCLLNLRGWNLAGLPRGVS